MATKEIERFKQILPKISARLADKKDRLIAKMKELRIFEENVDIFITLAESNNSEILKYLKEMLRIEGLETIVRDIEGKPAQEGNYTENSTTSADNGSDSLRAVLESESSLFIGELREIRQQMMKELKAIRNEIQDARAEARADKEVAKKREDKLLMLISKLEKKKDVIIHKMEENPTGINETDAKELEKKCQDLQTTYEQLLKQMKKMGEIEKGLRDKINQLQTEIRKLQLQLISMQVSRKGKMDTKITAPTRENKDKK